MSRNQQGQKWQFREQTQFFVIVATTTQKEITVNPKCTIMTFTFALVDLLTFE
jgi:hypothetical protein